MRRFSVSVVLVLGAIGVGLACSDDARPGVTEDGTASSTSSSSSSGGPLTDDGGGGIDGDAEPDEIIGPGLCENVVQASQVVGEWNSNALAKKPAGGAITRGMYVLNEILALGWIGDMNAADPPAPGPTGSYARSTIYVGPKAMRFTESSGTDADNLPADTVHAASYSTAGSNRVLTNACPSAQGSSTIAYTAAPNLLTFHLADDKVHIYRLVP